MTWNYRMTVQTVNGEDEWALRELYYDQAGAVVNWTKDPIAPTGETAAEADAAVFRMSAATKLPAYDLDAGRWCDQQRRAVR